MNVIPNIKAIMKNSENNKKKFKSNDYMDLIKMVCFDQIYTSYAYTP